MELADHAARQRLQRSDWSGVDLTGSVQRWTWSDRLWPAETE